jgi:hypothetical protein
VWHPAKHRVKKGGSGTARSAPPLVG